jgi:hypothetical protein
MKQIFKTLDAAYNNKLCYMCKYFKPLPSQPYDGECLNKNIKCFQPFSWWELEYTKTFSKELTKCKGKLFSPGGKVYNVYKELKQRYNCD